MHESALNVESAEFDAEGTIGNSTVNNERLLYAFASNVVQYTKR